MHCHWLFLARRVGETIIIDKKVRVTVLAAKGNQLRLGIDAPADIEVHREEIYNRIYGINQDTEKKSDDENFNR